MANISGKEIDFAYDQLTPWLVQPTVSEALAQGSCGRAAEGTATPIAAPNASPEKTQASPAELAKDLFGAADLANEDMNTED